jgi:hypothetical protein
MAPPWSHEDEGRLLTLILLEGMKVDIVNYVARCLECQQVKDEHRHP